MPQRIRLQRVKGWTMPANTICVARPSKWGNPYKVKSDLGERSHEEVVRLFRDFVDNNSEYRQRGIAELKGKNLACYCRLDQVCHADVLLEIANAK